jgi:hypothetical protein
LIFNLYNKKEVLQAAALHGLRIGLKEDVQNKGEKKDGLAE